MERLDAGVHLLRSILSHMEGHDCLLAGKQGPQRTPPSNRIFTTLSCGADQCCGVSAVGVDCWGDGALWSHRALNATAVACGYRGCCAVFGGLGQTHCWGSASIPERPSHKQYRSLACGGASCCVSYSDSTVDCRNSDSRMMSPSSDLHALSSIPISPHCAPEPSEPTSSTVHLLVGSGIQNINVSQATTENAGWTHSNFSRLAEDLLVVRNLKFGSRYKFRLYIGGAASETILTLPQVCCMLIERV